jgi:outer membrane protein
MAALAARTVGFTAGVNTTLGVLTPAAIFTPKRDRAPARYDWRLNLPRLKQAAGTLSETDLARINAWLP